MPRLRDLDVDLSDNLPTGPLNALTDVAGVRVGHTTLADAATPHIRTGVTAVIPAAGDLYLNPLAAAVHTINGFGKATGFEQVREMGQLEAPILLTNTLSVGAALDAGIAYMVRHHPEVGDPRYASVNVIVGECADSYLNDMRGMHITREHVLAAIEGAAGGPVAEGCVGAGTGTTCYQFKGGIGTASRVVPDGYTVGALVQTNMGRRKHLRMLGVRVGRHLTEDLMPEPPPGSIIIVLATDAPMNSAQLARLARRAPFGLARTGTTGSSGSGDFAMAFSVARSVGFPDERRALDAMFTAAVEAIEESILNALLAATTTTGKDGHTLHALPFDRIREMLARA